MPRKSIVTVLLLMVIATPVWADVNSDLGDAAMRGDVDAVRVLLRRGANINTRDSGGQTSLMTAIALGHDSVILDLLSKGADVNIKGPGGETALIYAALHDDTFIVGELLKKGADVNAKTKDGETPLIFAAKRGHIEVIKDLVDAGADVNAKDKDNMTALKWVAKNHTMMVRILKRESFYPLKIIDKTSQAKTRNICSFSAIDFSDLYLTEHVEIRGKIKNNCNKSIDIHFKTNVFGKKNNPVGSRDLWIKSIPQNITKEVKIIPTWALGGKAVDLTILEIK